MDEAGATRVDARTGVTTTIDFVGPPGARCFSILDRPPGEVQEAVVMCPSICGELLKNYRREVLIGRALAMTGSAVERFHYRGTGHSDGDILDVTFDSLVADAVAAGARLRAAVDVDRVVFAGTRFGALVAAAASAAVDGAGFVGLDPVLEARTYFREAFRTVMMQSVAERTERPTAEVLVDRLHADGYLDVLGDVIPTGLYDTAIERTVVDALAGTQGRVLLIQLSDRDGPAGAVVSAADALEASGVEVETRVIAGKETWWYLDERELLMWGDDDGADQPAEGADERTSEPVGTHELARQMSAWLADAREGIADR